MESKIERAEAIIGHAFNQKDLLWEALQVAGSGQSRIGGRDTTNGNQRLALLGDVVMGKVLCDAWFDSGSRRGRHHPSDSKHVIAVMVLTVDGSYSGLDRQIPSRP